MSAIAARPHTGTAPGSTDPRTEVVVAGRGDVRVSGHLTAQGADLLRGTVESLHRGGQATVVVDLHGIRAADAAGLALLAELSQSLAGSPGRLRLLG